MSSGRRLVRLDLAIVASIAAVGVLGSVVAGSVSPAEGYVSAPYLGCVNSDQSNLRQVEASLTPVNGATVQAGALVAFAGQSEAPLRFAVASSPALLSNPDIDSGPGSTPPQPSSSGSPLDQAYTFTSTRAAITAGTVYWDASFSDATFTDCTGLTPTTYTTHIRTLTISPAPTLPPTTPPTPSPPAEPLPLQVGIGVTSSFRIKHPIVTYRIHCSEDCVGETSYQAFVLRHHAKRAVHTSKLGLGPEAVSITSPTGGDEQFTQIYSGDLLQMLRTVARTGGILELRITVKVTGASGSVARAQHTARLIT